MPGHNRLTSTKEDTYAEVFGGIDHARGELYLAMDSHPDVSREALVELIATLDHVQKRAAALFKQGPHKG